MFILKTQITQLCVPYIFVSSASIYSKCNKCLCLCVCYMAKWSLECHYSWRLVPDRLDYMYRFPFLWELQSLLQKTERKYTRLTLTVNSIIKKSIFIKRRIERNTSNQINLITLTHHRIWTFTHQPLISETLGRF